MPNDEVAPRSVPEQHIGPYRLLRELGRGGMGVVFLGERNDGQFRRRVAIKLLRNTPDTEELHRRFLAERQILASLNHPNIAQLLDGGVTETHLPYLVMEFVDGVPLTTYCDRHHLTVDDRLRLFREVCAAVHHAHQNLVIHRDIKPSNILVTSEARVKLLDFGIAKLLNPMLGPADQPLTRTELRVMTPEYATPEQVRGETLTTASDVYALGVLLYELVCGRRPHRITSGSPRELEEVIVKREPALPSVAISRFDPARPEDETPTEPSSATIAADRRLPTDRLRRRLEGDLDAIVMMALRKESARRYSSADVMSEDIQRHLDGLPVLAHRSTRWYRAQKFLGRHRLQAVAVGIVAISLIGGTTVAVRQATEARRERDRAEQALSQSRAVTDFIVRLFRTQAPAGVTREQVTARDMLATGTARVEQLADQPIVQAQMLDALGRVNDQLGRFDDAERMLRRALELRRAHLGANHLDVAATLRNLSNVVRQKDDRAEALRLIREASAIQRRLLGPQHPDVAQTMITEAEMLADPAASESLLRSALEIQRAAYGNEHLAVAATKYQLANVLRRRNDAEAETLLRESLAIRERLLGPDDPTVVTGMIYLGNQLLSFTDKPAEAESLYNRALAILRKRPTESIPQLAFVLTSLTSVSSLRGDYARAETFAREALELQRRSLGAEHPLTTEYMALVARQLAGQGKYREAETLLRDALGLIERALGPQHARVAELLSPLAAVHAALGRYSEAEAELRRALATAELSSSRERSIAKVAPLLGVLLERRGDSTEAARLFERSASYFRPLPAQVGPDMRAAYAALADHARATRQVADEERFRRFSQGGSPWGAISVSTR